MIELTLAQFVLWQRYVEDVKNLEDVLSAKDSDHIHWQEMLIEAVLVELTVAALLLKLVFHMCTKGPSAENLLSVRCATNLCLEDVQKFVPQVLLVQEFNDQGGKVDLD